MKNTSSKMEVIYREMKERIAEGTWAVGDLLPTEFELAEIWGCSRYTISQAITRLAHDGIVERRKRSGTRILGSGSSQMGLEAYAFICPSEQHEGVWRTMKGFQQAAAECERRVLMLTTGMDYAKELEIIRRLPEFDVQGVVINSLWLKFHDWPECSDLINKVPMPLVQSGVSFPGFKMPSVVLDGFHASYTMTRYLLSKGCKHIGFFDQSDAAPSWWSVQYQGFQWAMKEAGCEVDTRLVYVRESENCDFEDPAAESKKFGGDYLDQVKGLGLEAVVCGTDYWALGLISAAEERGMDVPGDLLVTGIDDFSCAASASVPLTTYHVPYEEIGKKSFDVLNEMTSSAGWRENQKVLQVRGKLVVRKSA